VLLSDTRSEAFRRGVSVTADADVRGLVGAYLVADEIATADPRNLHWSAATSSATTATAGGTMSD